MLPFGKDMQKGKRNVRIFVLGSMLYVAFHGLLRVMNEKNPENIYTSILYNYFWYIAIIDACAMAILYRNYYGRSILKELTRPYETDEFDEKSHKYVPKTKNTPIIKSKNTLIEIDSDDDFEIPEYTPQIHLTNNNEIKVSAEISQKSPENENININSDAK